MRKYLICFLSIFFIFIFSCSRKQQEVRINKFSESDTMTTDTTMKQNIETEKNLTSSSGENILNITSSEANSYINANAVVKGYVADVVIREKVAYLNFDKKYPKNTFSAVIFEGKFSEVGDLSIYKNQNVEVKGIITEYKGKPQIIVSSKNQISVVK